jgi:acetyl esterase/lipase
MTSLAKRGYVVAAIEYRLRAEAPFPAAEQDTKSAIMWLRLNAATYNLDKGRVAVWGGSAGGQISALTAVTCAVAELEPPPLTGREGMKAPDPIAGQSSCVQAAVAWFGVYDFTTLREQAIPGGATNFDAPTSAASRFLGCAIPQCPPEQVRLAGAVNFATANAPPILLIHGLADVEIPYRQSVELRDELAAAGGHAQLLLLKNVGHGFIGADPELTKRDTTEALQATFDFFDRTIGPRSRQ